MGRGPLSPAPAFQAFFPFASLHILALGGRINRLPASKCPSLHSLHPFYLGGQAYRSKSDPNCCCCGNNIYTWVWGGTMYGLLKSKANLYTFIKPIYGL